MKNALLAIDMQNDILHPKGIRGTHDLPVPPLNPLVPNVAVLVDRAGLGLGIKPFAALPFLRDEGFREGTWGHALIDGIPPPDYRVRKWAYSGFWRSELDHVLRSLEATKLILCGFSTNGGVEATARNAVDRGYQIVTLSDATASYNYEIQKASLANLDRFGTVMTTDAFCNDLPR